MLSATIYFLVAFVSFLASTSSILRHECFKYHTHGVPFSSEGPIILISAGYQSIRTLRPFLPFMLIPSFASSQIDGDDIQDELLAEILAEEQREADELLKLEEEMRELNELKERHQKMQEEENANKMKPGQRMGGMGKNPNLDNVEEELRKKKADADAQNTQATEEQTLEEEEAERKAAEIAAKREAAYLAELEKIEDDKKRKALQRQKKRDTQIVRRVLRNSQNERHYSVLGLKCKWGEIKLGPLKFCSTPPDQIKRAYRSMARSVHPDKNRDGRAGQAFDALEKSASILMDPSQKSLYDARLKGQRKDAMDKAFVMLHNFWLSLRTVVRLLGPFATPILIILGLII
jgi:hypothetical protein